MSRISFITSCILSCKIRIHDIRHQSLQDPVPIRESIQVLGHTACCLDLRLKQEVNQVKVSTGMVIPITLTLHAESNSGRRGIGTRGLASQVPSPVVGSEGLASYDTVAESTASKVGVVLKGHVDDGDDDEDSSWTTNFFYPPRSHTIPKVV